MRFNYRILCFILSVLMCLTLFCGCKEEEIMIPDEAGWFTSWSCAVHSNSDAEKPAFKENTLRQQIMATHGGEKIRLTFSNEYATIPLELNSVHIAHLLKEGSPSIDTSTDTVVTFGGNVGVSIEPGQTVTSDEIDFSFEANDILAVSTHFGKFTGGEMSFHDQAVCHTWLASGDRVSDENFQTVSFLSSWYYLSRLEIFGEAGTKTIVAIGDSITDAACSTFNGFDGWTEQLAKMLAQNPETKHLTLANTAISGNGLLNGFATPVKDRFERDVLNINGVRYVLLMIGINDIGGAQEDISDDLIAQYKVLIEKCHERGIKIYACTLTPVKGNFYYSELHELIRDNVNAFILSEDSGFDGVIDMSMALASASDIDQMEDIYSCGDYLHPGAKGYEKMAQEAYGTLINIWAEEKAKLEEKEKK